MALHPRPLEHDPQEIVENVHPLPGSDGQADYASRDNMEDFLIERQAAPGRTIQRVLGHWRVYDVVESDRLVFDRWSYLPPVKDGRGWRRATLGGLLALNIGVNLINGNIQQGVSNAITDIKEEIDQGRYDWDNGHNPQTPACPTPGEKTTEIINRQKETESFYYSPNEIGESKPDLGIVDAVLDKIVAAKADSSVKSIEFSIKANTSDEWLELGELFHYGIGETNHQNTDLGQKRSEDSITMFNMRALHRGVDLDGVSVTITPPEEHVLDSQTQEQLTAEAQRFGYDTIESVLQAEKANPQALPQELQDIFEPYFKRNRQTEIRLATLLESQETRVVETPPADEDCPNPRPEDKDHDYDFLLLPFVWPAIPRFMRQRVEKLKGRWISMPDIHDPKRLLIHKDGVQENNELVKSAWAYVRKYMYLFREDDGNEAAEGQSRVRRIYEHGYLDDKGENQTLRALFVDHEPTADTVEQVARLFQIAGQIQGGRLGRECDAVVIYNSENAGLHGDAKRVGLGLDEQYLESTLGVAIPSLGLVEMHMPTVPTGAELNEQYNSAMWVLAHELVGHFSDLNNRRNVLNRVGRSAIGRDLYTLPDRFEGSSALQFERARSQERGRFAQVARRMRWLVRRGRETLQGNINRPVPDQEVVGVDDYRLREGLFMRKQTGNPSIYGSDADGKDYRSAVLESHAEAAAGEANPQIAIPFEQAPEEPARQITAEDPEQFTHGYRISDDWRRTLARRFGSQLTEDGISFATQEQARQHWTHHYGQPEQFEWAREIAQWARSVETPEPENPVWREMIVGQALAREAAKQRAQRKIVL